MRTKTSSVDYQERAQEFSVGDPVAMVTGRELTDYGTVTAVWPAIGMADVEWQYGNSRHPVEDLLRVNPGTAHFAPPKTNSTLGGPVKQATYWANADRQYRATQAEIESGTYRCPTCKDSTLKRAIYKRRDGKSERLLGCPECMFLIKVSDLLGCHHAESAV